MPKVIVGDQESLRSALHRLRISVRHAYRRQFYKTRIGCYEKPSDRKRRERRAKQRIRRIRATRRCPADRTVYIGLRGLHSKGEDPFRS